VSELSVEIKSKLFRALIIINKMSGWQTSDSIMEEDTGNDFPAVNNITVRGYLPSDTVPAPSKLLIR
jgi:hypothetical protein